MACDCTQRYADRGETAHTERTTSVIEIRPFIAGDWKEGASTATTENKYTGENAALVHVPTRAQVERATRAVAEAQEKSSLTPYARYEVLTTAARLVMERKAAFVDSIVLDTGFPLSDAAKEV